MHMKERKNYKREENPHELNRMGKTLMRETRATLRKS